MSFAFEFLTILCGFSALQRAEIAEIIRGEGMIPPATASFSALQRAEIAEI